MQAFRDIVKGWFGKFILAVVCLLFVLLGSEALLGLANKPAPMVIVEGEEISRDAVLSRVEQRKRYILQQYKGQINPDLIDDELLKANVLESMIKRLLAKRFIDENGMGVPQSFVESEILANANFQKDGKFSQTLFNQFVSRLGLTPSEYLDEVKFLAVLENLEKVLKATAYTTPNEEGYATSLEEQQRTFKYSRISHLDFKDEVSLSSDEVKSYYDENASQYMAAEAVKVEYILFDQSELSSHAEVGDDEISIAYDVYAERAQNDEKREAAHIHLPLHLLP